MDETLPMTTPTPLYDALLKEALVEFPALSIRYKSGSTLNKAINVFLMIVSFGTMRVYMTQYFTTLFGTLWVPELWDHMSDTGRVILLRHELVHMRQRRRMTGGGMALVYLVPFFPIGLAWGRAYLEREAYLETLKATYELYGLEAATARVGSIAAQFTGPAYLWMWPFPKTVRGWFSRALTDMIGQEKK